MVTISELRLEHVWVQARMALYPVRGTQTVRSPLIGRPCVSLATFSGPITGPFWAAVMAVILSMGIAAEVGVLVGDITLHAEEDVLPCFLQGLMSGLAIAGVIAEQVFTEILAVLGLVELADRFFVATAPIFSCLRSD
jgi:hypothetical protein